jgi:hypothetical protein
MEDPTELHARLEQQRLASRERDAMLLRRPVAHVDPAALGGGAAGTVNGPTK